MAIALARSLVACGGRCDALSAARAYANEYEMGRGYGGTAYKVGPVGSRRGSST